ncbi:UPF0755 protein [Meinhardsimonia xiamenensis]|jgi:UPF0755 protein|uniref:Endolytic murein transglycosylase n=1 Tax=Meinhardsimonia xiamenensis TaxID=990712 RepID=A0A1G9AI33_9RHOB|nr:endolytic transglycosylase MltG [Meinhardsimonia xiamenensis]PRX35398.1 UPF0755 protein [Meinhardsimonia xiamenensis]SDK26230.1 UPF0755 protein [Meinhardsimonia xiamenensis]
MWRHIASNALTLMIVVLVALGGFIAWAQHQYSKPGPLAEAICLRVAPGSNMARVSEQLAGQGAVTYPTIFRVGAQYAGKAQALKAGSFRIPPGASMAEIVDIVTRGGQSTCGTEIVWRIGVTRFQVQVRELDPVENRFVERASFDPVSEEPPEVYLQMLEPADTRFRLTVAEGVTSWQVVEGLKLVDVLTGEINGIPDEGSLAPDSYELVRGMSRAEVIAEMQRRQEERLQTAWANRAEDLPFETPEEALILASIVEKETGVPEERRIVASVFINRLKKGMRLQTDPTVIYGLTRGQGVLGRGIRQSELRRETPYNTYVIDGLPPTPIANPGLASIEAVLNPEETDFLYFVADGTGGHAFAKTLAEHNRNVARYREIERQRNGE